MADASYGSLPFSEQIAFFRRKLNLPTNTWLDIWQQAHDHAFVVAGANRMDLVEDFRAAVDRAIAEGATLADFRKDFDRIVAKHGWSYNGGRNWRSRVIYETNLRTSYAAGRYAQLQAVKGRRPYWQYVHSDSVSHPRPLHVAWDGKVLHADDPWWSAHYPPNGWGCRCTIHALNDRDLKRLGKDGPDQAPPTKMQDATVGKRGPAPRTVQTPAGVDPGFGYAPGKDAWMRQQATRTLQLDAAQARVQWQQLITTTAKDYDRPSRIPLAPPPASLGARLQTAAEVTEVLRRVIGAERKVYDVQGLPVVIDAEVLGQHLDPARAEYLPWLPDLLNDPYEVWLQLERETVTGAYRIRTRMVKAYDDGRGRNLLLVLDQQDGVMVGWTMLPTSDVNYVRKQRMGLLWWSQ